MFVGNQGALAPLRWVNIGVLPLRVMADTRDIMQLQLLTVKLTNEVMDLMDRVAKLELEAKENEN
tara:strand:+ start:297 stop:491 length:195 start_codon:yes stop_codon:yes gene_type:complete